MADKMLSSEELATDVETTTVWNVRTTTVWLVRPLLELQEADTPSVEEFESEARDIRRQLYKEVYGSGSKLTIPSRS